MCLSIKKKSRRNEIKRNFLVNSRVDKDGFIMGFKVVTSNNRSLYLREKINKGWNCSNRLYSWGNFVTGGENENGEIRYGCHIFVDKFNRVKTFLQKRRIINCFNRIKIIQIYFKPEDLVAVGDFRGYVSAVVTKYYVKSTKGVTNVDTN